MSRLPRLLIFLFLFCAGVCASAQSLEQRRQSSLEKQSRITALEKIIDSLNQANKVFADSILHGKEQVDQAQILLKELHLKADSLERVRKMLDEQKESIDYMTARFCFIRLGQRYVPRWTTEALDEWSHISSPSVLERYRNTDVRLRKYGAYYEELRGVFLSLMAPDKQAFASAAPDLFQGQAREAIRASKYYKEAFGKEDQRITYLDRIIDFAFRQIEQKSFNFSAWLDLVMPASQ